MSKLTDEVEMLRKKIAEAHIPKDLETRVLSSLEEATRLENDITARVHIEQMLRYVDLVVNLPWDTRTTDVLDLVKAREILEKNHYGLAPVKERILEYLSIIKLNQQRWDQEKAKESSEATAKISEDAKLSHAMLARRAPILCLVGLVGTGKTTLAKSIAAAMGRRFVRIPFGGMSDALDLRGQSRVRPDA